MTKQVEFDVVYNGTVKDQKLALQTESKKKAKAEEKEVSRKSKYRSASNKRFEDAKTAPAEAPAYYKSPTRELKTDSTRLTTTENLAKKTAEGNDENDYIFTIVDQAPAFPGGEKKQQEFIAKTMDRSKCPNCSGTVYITFVVSVTGELQKPEIVKGVKDCACLETEAKRIVNAMPKWEPGKQSGKAVSVQVNLAVKFE